MQRDAPHDVEVVVIGAGQAGLSAAYFLRHRGFGSDEFVVLDANRRPGGAWQHRSPTLTMAAVHGVHALPGLDFEEGDPQGRANEVVPAYFERYERRFELPVRRPITTQRVDDIDGRLVATTDVGRWRARGLINATGTWSRPFRPTYPGAAHFAGRQLHTADYRGPGEFAGQRVIVVGAGHSAVQHLAELADVAATTTWVTRRPPRWRQGIFDEPARRAAVDEVERTVAEGHRPASVVSVTGLIAPPAVAAARRAGDLERLPMFDRITQHGVAWADGRFLAADAILWATGFRHALDHLAPLGLRSRAGGIRMRGTQVDADPRIHLLGYGPSASTIGANRAARIAVRDLRIWLGRPAERSAPTHSRTRVGVRGTHR